MTVSELKAKVKVMTGIDVDDQRLLHCSKELQDNRNGKTCTLKDYDIHGGSNVILVVRLPGGYS